MDDDTPHIATRLERPLGRYAELYPSVLPRLRAMMASQDPGMRRRMAHLAEVIRRRAEGREERLIDRYGLTAAEARVAAHLADGGSIDTYATEAGVTRGTVRVQLKSVFAKTGVNRQASLVKLVRTPF